MPKKPSIIWCNTLLFIITFSCAIFLVPWRQFTHGFDYIEWLVFGVLIIWSGLSITAGYHRLWSHKSYQAKAWLRMAYALGGALALQNSVLHWCSDHRRHHQYVDDNSKDPYSAKMGFWYSHIGWMLREYHYQIYRDYTNVKDLQQDSIVIWQHQHYLLLAGITNLGLPLFLGWLNSDIWSMFLLAGIFRLVLVHHCTFFINSLAHIWGKQPYCDGNTAKDNGFLALVTFGEGYHNYHHQFEMDYRNGVKWWQFDPTKWLIRVLNCFGQTWSLKTVSKEKIETTQLSLQFKQASSRLKMQENGDELYKKLLDQYNNLKKDLIDYYRAKSSLINSRKQNLCCENLKQQVYQLKMQLASQHKRWHQLVSHYS